MRLTNFLICFLLFLTPAWSTTTPSDQVKILVTQDLKSLSDTARSKNIPILLVITQDHCPFCHTVKEEILNPMRLSGEYGNKVIIREMLIDDGEVVVDFSGKRRDARDVAGDYQVWVTPTLLFLNPDGRELSARILGVNTIELYGHYVDAGIDEALGRQRGDDASIYVPTKDDIGVDDGSVL